DFAGRQRNADGAHDRGSCGSGGVGVGAGGSAGPVTGGAAGSGAGGAAGPVTGGAGRSDAGGTAGPVTGGAGRSDAGGCGAPPGPVRSPYRGGSSATGAAVTTAGAAATV